MSQGVGARVIVGDSRFMDEVAASSVDLAVTSPPYWHIKDYAAEGQVGYGQTLHQYLVDLYRVWKECHRVLRPGRRLCINIGDQFARQAIYGRYKVIPLHAEIIAQCETLGFDYLGSIIWQKKTTMETSGGAVVMGSYPYPPNGIVELDYEFILLFKKPGSPPKMDPAVKERSQLTREEWKEYFSGHWRFGGAKQQGHEAMFPEELPRRLIRMFTFEGEVVLDPFLGSGTTLRAALNLDRSGMGYEVNPDFLPIIRQKLGTEGLPGLGNPVEFIHQSTITRDLPPVAYVPAIQDASPAIDPKEHEAAREPLHKVVEAMDPATLRLQSGQAVRFLGVHIEKPEDALRYLRASVVGRQVYVRTDGESEPDSGIIEGYVYLKNKIFINAYLVRSGLASADPSRPHRFSGKFEEEEGQRDSGLRRPEQAGEG